MLRDLPTDIVTLKSANMVGLDALGALLDDSEVLTGVVDGDDGAARVVDSDLGLGDLASLVDALAEQGHGLVMTMGKGGVGKTTIAAAIAVALAERGLPVHLTTTDPAAHLTDALDESLPNLEISRIDPEVETARYRETILRTKGATLDDAGRAGLEEDLRSPCTEEIAVFQAFSEVVNEGRRRFVIIDTAPTGHTLLLLDATGSYHRDVQRQRGSSASFTTPMMRLQDRDHTKVIIVTLAEATPVLEAAELQADLRRAGIEPWAWVINSSLAATATTHPLLRRRARTELTQIAHVVDVHAARAAIIPLRKQEPVGVLALRDLTTARRVVVLANA